MTSPFRRPPHKKPTGKNARDERGLITVTIVLRHVDNSAVKGNKTRTLRVAEATVTEVANHIEATLFREGD